MFTRQAGFDLCFEVRRTREEKNLIFALSVAQKLSSRLKRAFRHCVRGVDLQYADVSQGELGMNWPLKRYTGDCHLNLSLKGGSYHIAAALGLNLVLCLILMAQGHQRAYMVWDAHCISGIGQKPEIRLEAPMLDGAPDMTHSRLYGVLVTYEKTCGVVEIRREK